MVRTAGRHRGRGASAFPLLHPERHVRVDERRQRDRHQLPPSAAPEGRDGHRDRRPAPAARDRLHDDVSRRRHDSPEQGSRRVGLAESFRTRWSAGDDDEGLLRDPEHRAGIRRSPQEQ